jgi:hypothetical protein
MVALGMATRRRIGSVGAVPITIRVSKMEAQIAKFTLVNSSYGLLDTDL